MTEEDQIRLDNTDQNYSTLARLSSTDYFTEVEGFRVDDTVDEGELGLWIDARSVPEYLSSRFPIGGEPMDVTIRPFDENETHPAQLSISIMGETPEYIVKNLLKSEDYDEWRQNEELAENIGPDHKVQGELNTLLEAKNPRFGKLVGENIIVHTQSHQDIPDLGGLENLENYDGGEIFHPELGS